MNLEALFLFAPTGEAGGSGMAIFLFQMLAIVAIFYFLIIRPKVKQERDHRKSLETIKKGDEVVTAGGVIGEVVHIKDSKITIKSGDSRLIIERDRIAQIRGSAAKREEAKK